MNNTDYSAFSADIAFLVGMELVELDVTDAQGEHNVVLAFEHEPLSTLQGRIAKTGGYANVFVKGHNRIRQVSVVPSSSSLYEGEGDNLSTEPPSANIEIGTFLDYLATQGVITIPAARPVVRETRAANVREVELAGA